MHTIGIAALSAFLSFASCASNERTDIVRTPGQIVCSAPPKELSNPQVSAETDIAVAKIGQLVKGDIHGGVRQERVRQELNPQVTNWEVIDYRLCNQYASGVLTREEYVRFTSQVLPVLREIAPVQPGTRQSTSGDHSPAVNDTRGDVTFGHRPPVGGASGPPSNQPGIPPTSNRNVAQPDADDTAPASSGVTQTTTGSNSPAISGTRGNVTINGDR